MSASSIPRQNIPHPPSSPLLTRFARVPAWCWLLLIALGLRLFRLGTESLWYDELGTAWIAKLNYSAMLATLRVYDVHPPLWYSIVWLVEHTLGNSEFLLRLPAAVFGTGAVLLLWRIAGQLGFEPRTALVAGLIAAVFPGILYYSQEARMYTLLMCATLGAIWAILSNRWAWFALCGVAIVYSHNLGLLYVGVLGSAVLLLRLPRPWLPMHPALLWKAWRGPLLALIVIGLCWLPWLPSFLEQARGVKNGFWLSSLSLVGLIEPYIELPMGIRSVLTIDLSAYTAALAISVVSVWFSRKWLFRDNNGRLIAALLFGMPLTLAVISWVWQPIYLARSMIGAVVLLALLWAWFLCHARKLDRQTALWILTPMLAITLINEYLPAKQGRDPVRDHVATVTQQWQPGDVAYFTSFWTVTVDDYYLGDRPYAVRPNSADGSFWHPNGVLLGSLMDFRQADFDHLRVLGYKRAWFMVSLSALSDPHEPDAIATILNANPYRLFYHYRAEDGSDISVYLINLYPEF